MNWITAIALIIICTPLLSFQATAGQVSAAEKEVFLPQESNTEDYEKALDALKGTRGLLIVPAVIRPELGTPGKLPKSSAPTSAGTATSSQSPVIPSTISIKVYFAYDSAKLTPEAVTVLEKFGAALSQERFKSDKWMIEGHTDAAGNANYNQRLSERRARSVYNYLLHTFNIKPENLIAVGMGERDLYDPDHPFSGTNRRVRIKHIGN